MKRKIIDFILGYDFIIAVIATGVSFYYIPEYIDMKFALSFYNIGISVLSIVFSVFFAALAIIVSASDNDFIDFMEEDGSFSTLIWTYKFTLFALFVSLVYSIVLYVSTNYYLDGVRIQENEFWTQHSVFFLIFELLFIYSLVSTVMGVKNSILFTEYRLRFLKHKKSDKKDKS